MRKPIIIVLLVALLAPVLAASAEVKPEEIREVGLQPLKPGTQIIDFELADTAGVKHKLSDYKGKVVFLNFWATWCGPCRFEMPSMQRLYQSLKADGLVVVAVNLQEDPASVGAFVKELGLSFPVLLDRTGRIGSTYGARSIPTSYIIDRQGFVVAGTIGTREWDTEEYKEFFAKLLE